MIQSDLSILTKTKLRNFSGNCSITYVSSAVFQGKYIDEIRSGYGTLEAADSMIQGNFEGDVMYGEGELTTEASKFKGYFKDSISHGQGVEYEHEECVYSGTHYKTWRWVIRSKTDCSMKISVLLWWNLCDTSKN